MTNENTDNDQFLSFAKRSRTVWRSYETEKTFMSAPFWRRFPPVHDRSGMSEGAGLHYLPRNFLVAENYVDTSAEMAGCTVSPKPLPGQWLPRAPEKLPTPRELMGHRRRGGRREGIGGSTGGDVAQHKAAAVLHHIRDLKKRQSAIDKLKTEKWWNSANCEGSQGDLWGPMGGCPLTSGDQISKAGWGHSPAPTQIPQGLYDQEVTFGTQVEELNLIPGGNSMRPFVKASADRQDRHCHNIPFWHPKDFGGTWYNIEQ